MITGGTYTPVIVKDSDTLYKINALAGTAESFKLTYYWEHKLTIQDFNPSEDVIDLTAFWGQVNEAVLGSSNGNVTLSLSFNKQTVTLEGVGADQINQINLN